MALTAAIASIAPLGAAAADSAATTQASATTTIIAPGASFDVVDKATGNVLGRLVAVGNNSEVIAKMADVARDQKMAQANYDRGTLLPETPAELAAYWNRVLPMLVG